MPTGLPTASTFRSEQIEFISKLNGRDYHLKVSWPTDNLPARSLPVIYVLDGDWYFGAVTDAIRSRLRGGDDLAPALVVGVGYPQNADSQDGRRRTFDLTPDAPSTIEPFFGDRSWEFGGLDRFLDILEYEVRPLVLDRYGADRENSILFGHSFGGLAVLHALFTRSSAYRTYISLDPSIWWNNRSVLAAEPNFCERVIAGEVAARIYVASAGRRNDRLSKELTERGLSDEQIRAITDSFRMVQNAADLASRLQVLNGSPKFHVNFKNFIEDTHGSIPYTALASALEFALPAVGDA